MSMTSERLPRLQISVLTPVLNAAKYIDRAINSVLIQDYSNWEHIVVDGGSKDATVEILRRYPHLKWVSEEDCGQSDAMNKAFEMSEGGLIVYLNMDDWFHEGAFSTVVDYFESQSQADFVYGKLNKVFRNEERVFTASHRIHDILRYWPCTFPGNPVSYFYRRHVQEEIGPFPLENHFTMDYWFLLRVYRRYRVGFVDTVLGSFQCFDNKSADVDRAKEDLKNVRDQFLREYPLERLSYEWHNVKRKLVRKVRSWERRFAQ